MCRMKGNAVAHERLSEHLVTVAAAGLNLGTLNFGYDLCPLQRYGPLFAAREIVRLDSRLCPCLGYTLRGVQEFHSDRT
jgi:hypothetical protein